MFKKKQPPQPERKKGSGAALAKQLGIFNSDDGDDGLNDNDLLAELEQIQSGSGGAKGKPSKTARKPNAAALFDIEKMAAASMRDIGSDEDMDDDPDPEDADLLSELMELEAGSGEDEEPGSPAGPSSPVKVVAAPSQVTSSRSTVDLITERLQMYLAAEETAKTSGDVSKAKRMERGIKTLNEQLKAAKAGKTVAVDDLPPPVAGTSKTPTTSPQHRPSQPDVVQKPSQPAELPAWQKPGPSDQDSGPVASAVARVPPVPAPKSAQPPAPAPKPAQPPTPAVKPSQPPAPAPKPSLAPTAPAPKPTSTSDTLEAAASAVPKKGHDDVQARRAQYKQAALDAKNSNDLATAKKYMVIVKQFDLVLEAMDNGQPVDLSQMPPPLTSSRGKATLPTASATASARPGGMSQSVSTGELAELPPIPELSAEAREKLFHAPAGASSVMEALQQRLEKFRSTAAGAKEEGNATKARRLDRIVLQYEDAITQHKAGKPVDYDSLPTPPGFPPIPVPTAAAGVQAPAAVAPLPVSQPVRPAPAAAPAAAADKPKPKAQMTRSEQQLTLLKERHQELRRAAQTAKKDGDVQMAKDYLRLSLGLEKMIAAAESGLPVDMTQVPPAPSSASDDFELLTADDVSSDRDDMYKKLEEQLVHQIQVCMTNASHYSKMGDVGGANRFEKMLANDQKDLDALRQANRQGHPVPQFHYEAKTFSLVQSFPELGDNDFEVTVVRGINYSVPSGLESKDLDTYVVFEFPFPTEVPQKGETATCRHTHNPEYKQTFKLQADRKSRTFLRVLKAKAIKLEVYYKRGFLKKDQLLGSASVKIAALENSCLLHESYDLMDGRKAVGGKVEVRLRVREPYVSKQVEQTREKWLIIDRFVQRSAAEKLATAAPSVVKSVSNNSLGKVTAAKQSPSQSPLKRVSDTEWTSVEVLKFEKHLLDQQIERYKGKLTPGELEALSQKAAKLARDARDMDAKLKAGGRDAQQGYMRALETALVSIGEEARTLAQQGNRDKAQVLLAKKKLVEKEIESLKAS